MDEYEIFLEHLTASLNTIGEEYFYTQYNQFYAIRNRLRTYGYYRGQRFLRHSERGFAYEFYFKMRMAIDETRAHRDFFPGYFLQGEIKKIDVPEVLQIFGYQRLGGNLIPDLLFHVPTQDANAFVIEIKAQPELEAIEVMYDIDKLTRFLRGFNYRKAVFIAVNISFDAIYDIIRSNRVEIAEMFNGINMEDCHVIVKENPGPANPTFNQTIEQILI